MQPAAQTSNLGNDNSRPRWLKQSKAQLRKDQIFISFTFTDTDLINGAKIGPGVNPEIKINLNGSLLYL